MGGKPDRPEVRRVEVSDPIAVASPGDYADAFEVQLPGSDVYPPETWVRAGLEATPPGVKRIVRLMGSRRASRSPTDEAPLWRVVESGPEVVHLELSNSLVRAVMVGRRVEPTRRRLTTVVYYERPRLARLVWAVIGPRHRRTAALMVTSKISTSDRAGDADFDRAP